MKRNVVNVTQTLPVNQRLNHFSGVWEIRQAHCGRQLRQSRMISAINVSGSEGDRREPAWQWLARHRYDDRGMAFSVSQEVLSLSSSVLHSIAANCPFARNASVQQAQLVVVLAQR